MNPIQLAVDLHDFVSAVFLTINPPHVKRRPLLVNKVGAALSMCYKTGQPILFVGTGQKYTHLRKLNVNYVIKALFG